MSARKQLTVLLRIGAGVRARLRACNSISFAEEPCTETIPEVCPKSGHVKHMEILIQNHFGGYGLPLASTGQNESLDDMSVQSIVCEAGALVDVDARAPALQRISTIFASGQDAYVRVHHVGATVAKRLVLSAKNEAHVRIYSSDKLLSRAKAEQGGWIEFAAGQPSNEDGWE